MRRNAFVGLMGLVLGSAAGCCFDSGPARVYKTSAVFTDAGLRDGATEYETENLLVRLLPRETMGFFQDALLANVRIENKRDVFAHLSSRWSCIVDEENGANNLLAQDRILPPRSFLNLADTPGSLLGFRVMTPWFFYVGDMEPRTGAQRLLARIEWEDGVSERIDLSYRVTLVEEQAR